MKNKTALKGGTYSIVLTTIVLAILVVVNIFAQALPSSATQYDISSTKLYSITSNTKVVVNALKEDVTIYWVVLYCQILFLKLMLQYSPVLRSLMKIKRIQ